MTCLRDSTHVLLLALRLVYSNIVKGQTTSHVSQDLGIYLDADASMTTHVTKSTSSCFAVLRQIRAVRRFLKRPVLLSLIVSLVMSRMDYSNATLAGSPSYMFDKLQPVLNAAAHLIFSKRRFDSVTPLLRDLHWLRVYHSRVSSTNCRTSSTAVCITWRRNISVTNFDV